MTLLSKVPYISRTFTRVPWKSLNHIHMGDNFFLMNPTSIVELLQLNPFSHNK